MSSVLRSMSRSLTHTSRNGLPGSVASVPNGNPATGCRLTSMRLLSKCILWSTSCLLAFYIARHFGTCYIRDCASVSSSVTPTEFSLWRAPVNAGNNGWVDFLSRTPSVVSSKSISLHLPPHLPRVTVSAGQTRAGACQGSLLFSRRRVSNDSVSKPDGDSCSRKRTKRRRNEGWR